MTRRVGHARASKRAEEKGALSRRVVFLFNAGYKYNGKIGETALVVTHTPDREGFVAAASIIVSFKRPDLSCCIDFVRSLSRRHFYRFDRKRRPSVFNRQRAFSPTDPIIPRSIYPLPLLPFSSQNICHDSFGFNYFAIFSFKLLHSMLSIFKTRNQIRSYKFVSS